jgi:hypothetical protein
MTFAIPEATASSIEIVPGAAEAANRPNNRFRVPLVMPSDQEYYWRFTWQHEERQCLLELDAGNWVTFDSDDPEDAARWLREPEDS